MFLPVESYTKKSCITLSVTSLTLENDNASDIFKGSSVTDLNISRNFNVNRRDIQVYETQMTTTINVQYKFKTALLVTL
jgi:preprotein translocase subunit SecB